MTTSWLDEWDVRPLLIDQPEENFFFREAANRRQIILVRPDEVAGEALGYVIEV
jgi:hypothetical protein